MVTDFTDVRTWAGFVYVAFIVDVFAQRIVAWHAATTKHTDLVMTPLRIAIWQRDREGRPVTGSERIHHSDAGSPEERTPGDEDSAADVDGGDGALLDRVIDGAGIQGQQGGDGVVAHVVQVGGRCH